MDSSLSGIDRRRVVASAAWLAIALAGASAFANLRAPRVEAAMPSSAVRPADAAPQLRVMHEELTFRCHGRSCQVTATYAVDSEAPLSAELVFVLAVDTAVFAHLGGATVPATVTRLNGPPPSFTERLDLRREYMLPDAQPLPPLYQAVAPISFVRGNSQISFSYDQPLGALETGHSYFHEGSFVPRLFYVLWPLREWKRAPGFTIALRIEMDREPPGWWKRTFGSPPDVYCHALRGQQVQVGRQLVYTATLTEEFPDYLQCSVGG